MEIRLAPVGSTAVSEGMCSVVFYISVVVAPIVCYKAIVVCPLCRVVPFLVLQPFCYWVCCFTLIVSLMPYGCGVLCPFLMVMWVGQQCVILAFMVMCLYFFSNEIKH